MLRLTKAQIDNYRQIKEISFKKLRSFTDYSLSSGIEEGTAKNLLIDFFKSRQTFKKGNRITTRSIYRQTKNGKYNNVCIIEYICKHGFGYAWSQDLENEFISWVISTYKLNKTSKTYNLLLQRSLFNF